MNLFNLFATLTLDNSDYEKKLDQSQKSAGSFSSKIGTAFKTGVRAVAGFVTGVAAASAAIGALVVKFVDAGSEIDDNAQKLGISTESYQYWSLVLQRAGSDASNLSMVIRNLTTFTNELSTGQGDALLTLQKLGIGYEDFMAMNTEEQLYAIVEALQGVESQTDKVQLAQEIFGNRVYQELLPLLGMQQGSLEDLKDEFEGLGLIIEDEAIKQTAALGDKFDNLTNSFKVGAFAIATELLPEIELITDGLMGLASGSDDAMQSLTDGLVGLIDKIATSLPTIIQTAGDLLLQVITGLADVLSDPTVIQALVDVVENLLFKAVEILPTLTQSIAEIAVALFDALLHLDWTNLIINLVKALIDIALVQLPSMISKMLFSLIDTAFDMFFTREGSKKLFNFGIDLIKEIGKGIINGLTNLFDEIFPFVSDFWNSVLDIFNTSDGKGEYTPGGGYGGGGGSSWAKGGMMTTYANGGFFGKYTKGTLYALAGEAGAEIVAHGPRGTGVANIEQIADAQYMAMQDYDLRGAIQNAAVAIVNGIVTGLGNQDNNTEITVRIGDKDFNSYVVNTVNNTLRAQGRKSLRTITAYK